MQDTAINEDNSSYIIHFRTAIFIQSSVKYYNQEYENLFSIRNFDLSRKRRNRKSDAYINYFQLDTHTLAFSPCREVE
jgi:hypothetical protein